MLLFEITFNSIFIFMYHLKRKIYIELVLFEKIYNILLYIKYKFE